MDCIDGRNGVSHRRKVLHRQFLRAHRVCLRFVFPVAACDTRPTLNAIRPMPEAIGDPDRTGAVTEVSMHGKLPAGQGLSPGLITHR